MELHKLKELSEKYWEGACSDQEEAQLRRALQLGEVPDEYRVLATYLTSTQQWSQEETLGEAFDQTVFHTHQRRQQRQKQWRYVASIAASIALILSLTFVLRNSFSSSISQEVSTFTDTYEDSELAYQEVKKALMMMSSEMNKGKEHTQMLGKFHQTKTEIKNQKKQ